VLARQGELTLGELAARERIAPPSMTRIAASLERSGLIERHPDPTDRRVARLAISQAGQRLLQMHRARGDSLLSGWLESLAQEELAVLASAIPLLERLVSAQAAEHETRARKAYPREAPEATT
jgi:DNA-binding MarR family transcriptional regulator